MPEISNDYADVGVDLKKIESEVEAGLPNERERIKEAQINLDYLHGENAKYVPMRSAEDPSDYQNRPKRVSYLTKAAVEALTKHTYNPGPSRKLEAPRADAWYQSVLRDEGVNAKMVAADKLAHLNDVAMLQVAATGNPRRPVCIHVRGSEEFAVWTSSGDPITPVAVCTISRVDEQTTYELWSPAAVRTYQTQKLGAFQTAGGRVARLIKVEPNPYGGVLPFVFLPFEHQTRSFWVHGVGSPLRKANAHVDEALSELAESLRYYGRPMLFSTDAAPGWRPRIKPGTFNEVPAKAQAGPNPVTPSVFALHVPIDVNQIWQDIQNYEDMTLTDVGVPHSALRMVQSHARSGAAIISEQLPLLARSKQRRSFLEAVEVQLLKTVCQVGASFYEWPGELQAELEANAVDPQISFLWPSNISIPSLSSDAEQDRMLSLGLLSPVQVLQERLGGTREQALEMIEQVVRDNADLARIRAGEVVHDIGAAPEISEAVTASDDPETDGDGDLFAKG